MPLNGYAGTYDPENQLVFINNVNASNALDGPVDLSGTVQDAGGTGLCAMVLVNGQFTFSCDASGSYALNIPLDTNGQVKLQVYGDGFAPTVLTFDEFSPNNDVRMARAVECQ